MNLVEIDESTKGSLLGREKCIGFFVYQGNFVWIVDWPDNFTLNQQKNIDALCTEERYRRFLPSGLTVAQWSKKLQDEFRGGIPVLTSEHFPKYRDGQFAKVVNTSLLRSVFFSEDVGQYAELSSAMEKELSFNTVMPEELVQLRSRLFSMLPKFYINYDRRIFMHMVRGRSYENVVLDGWWGAAGDFEHMIPPAHRYWVRNINEDFWAVTNFSNCD